MMNFGRKLPIFYNFCQFLENPPMFKETLPKKDPCLENFELKNPSIWAAHTRTLNMLCYSPGNPVLWGLSFSGTASFQFRSPFRPVFCSSFQWEPCVLPFCLFRCKDAMLLGCIETIFDRCCYLEDICKFKERVNNFTMM